MKRLIAVLCALLMLVNAAVAESTFVLPGDLKEIGEEAFLSVSAEDSLTDGPDTIIVPEGTEKIRARAFANSVASRIELPESLSFIADDAFEGCGNATLCVWRDSYAHQWCMAHDVRYSVRVPLSDENLYEVHSVDIAESADGETVLRSAVTTAEACFLRVDVLDDAGANILSTSTAPVEAAQSNLTVDVLPSAVLPQYFVLRAVLTDEDGNELCAPVTNSRHTSVHEEFTQQTPDDFAGENVVDFGEYGFAVLADGVIPLNASAAESGSGYTFATSQSLKAGNIVLLNVDGTPKPVKIASVTDNGNGTVTVVQDTNAGLDELYSFINVSGEMVADGVQAASLDDEGMTLSTKKSISIGDVRVGYTLKATIRATFIYNEETDYLDTSILIDTEGSLEAFFGKKYDTWKKGNAPSITLFMTGVKIPYVDIEGTFKVTVPVNVQASVGGNASIGFNNHYGYTYNSADGFQKVEESNASTADVDLKGQFAIKVGPEVSLNLQLFDFLIGRIGGQAGALLEGKVTNPSGEYGDSTDSLSRHACDQCVDMDLSADVNLRATLTGKVGKISITFIDYNLGLYKEKICDFYLSFDNEPESVHGGETVFGAGTCPNYQYLTKILAKKADGTDAPNTPITLTGDKIPGDSPYTGSSPYKSYLYPGSYTASAAFDSGNVYRSFDVTRYAETIPIYEHAIVLKGDVRDVDTYKVIPGATVTLTLPDGSIQSQTTGADGTFRFESLPPGVYTVTASAQGYKPYTYTTPEYTLGTTYNLSITLVRENVAIEGTVIDSETSEPISGVQITMAVPDGSTRTGVTDGAGAFAFEDLPEGLYTIEFTKDGYQTKEVNHTASVSDGTDSLTVEMVRGGLPVLTAYADSAGTVQALAPDGTIPEGVPEVTLTVTENDYGFIGKVVVSHENCEGTLSRSATYAGYVDFFGVDMGNGEYTYVLGLGNAGTGGGCDITVFREVNGVLETCDLSLGKIGVEGTFSSNTRFSATILPGNISISGTMPLPYDGFKRTGHDLSAMGSGYLDYEKNEDGAYDLIYSLRIASGGYNWDNIGNCMTRYVMEDNSIVMDSQWFEMYEGGTLD